MFKGNFSKNWWPQYLKIANIRILLKNHPKPSTFCPSHHNEVITVILLKKKGPKIGGK